MMRGRKLIVSAGLGQPAGSGTEYRPRSMTMELKK